MKEIVVAIDFSKDSLNALKLAILIANQVKANITMVWVNKPGSSQSLYKNSDSLIIEEAKNRFEQILLKHKCLMKHGTLKYKIRKGKVYKEIINQAKYLDAFLIIAGTHGVSGFEEFWIGSNAYKMVTSSPCPVITIRYGFKISKRLSRIVIPIDSTFETREKVPLAVEIAKFFNAEVHLLTVYTSSINEVKKKVDAYTAQAEKYINEQKVKLKKSKIETNNLADAVITYATDVKADLIAIMSEQETTVSNIWLGSYAQQIVNHSPIPVLTVHSKNIIEILPRL